MTDDDKNIRMEQLRASLLKDIELQEQVRATYEKILRRSAFILAIVALVLISMVGFVIYTISRPTPATEITLKHIEELEKNIQLDRYQLGVERIDIRIAREQVLKMQQQMLEMDSIRKITKDSLYYLP